MPSEGEAEGSSFVVFERVYNDQMCATYKEACQKMGLYHDDREWDLVMEEAHQWKFSKALRELASNIIMYPWDYG